MLSYKIIVSKYQPNYGGTQEVPFAFFLLSNTAALIFLFFV